MAPITCVVLTRDQAPVAGLRVTLACLESPFLFQASTSPNGIVDQWTQLSVPPLPGPTVVDAVHFSVCRLTFAVADHSALPESPWPTIQGEMRLANRSIMVLCYDSLGYQISTTVAASAPPAPSPTELSLEALRILSRESSQTTQSNSPMNTSGFTQARRGSGRMGRTVLEPTQAPSPMQGVEFAVEIGSALRSRRRQRHRLARETGVPGSRGGNGVQRRGLGRGSGRRRGDAH